MNHLDRMLVDGTNRDEWLAARVGKIGGSDAASFSKIESAHLYIRSKLYSPFNGNAYTAHGNDRERAMLAAYGIQQNRALFRSELNERHVCTPDGVILGADGAIALAQCKTSNSPMPRTIPRAYLRQMWWEQYVMGADRTLLIWEHHEGFSPVDMEPESRVITRDDDEIERLVTIANIVLGGMDAAERFRNELGESNT